MGLIKTLTIGGETYDIQPAKVGQGLEVAEGVLSLKTDDSLRFYDSNLSVDMKYIVQNSNYVPLYINSSGRIQAFEFAYDDDLGRMLPQLRGGGLCLNATTYSGRYGLGLNVGISPYDVRGREGALVSINSQGCPFVPFNNIYGLPCLAWNTPYGIHIDVTSLKDWIKNEFGL